MLKIEIKGLKELRKKLKKLPDDMLRETERKLREAVDRIVRSARMKCPNPELREKITSRVLKVGKQISVTITAPEEARIYLEQAFEEIKDTIPKEVAEAVREAIRK